MTMASVRADSHFDSVSKAAATMARTTSVIAQAKRYQDLFTRVGGKGIFEQARRHQALFASRPTTLDLASHRTIRAAVDEVRPSSTVAMSKSIGQRVDRKAMLNLHTGILDHRQLRMMATGIDTAGLMKKAVGFDQRAILRMAGVKDKQTAGEKQGGRRGSRR